jgi:hypothetical protein
MQRFRYGTWRSSDNSISDRTVRRSEQNAPFSPIHGLQISSGRSDYRFGLREFARAIGVGADVPGGLRDGDGSEREEKGERE